MRAVAAEGSRGPRQLACEYVKNVVGGASESGACRVRLSLRYKISNDVVKNVVIEGRDAVRRVCSKCVIT